MLEKIERICVGLWVGLFVLESEIEALCYCPVSVSERGNHHGLPMQGRRRATLMPINSL